VGMYSCPPLQICWAVNTDLPYKLRPRPFPKPTSRAMKTFEQSPGRMVFSTTMSSKARLGFCAVSLVPLLAPYELLVKPGWTDVPNLAWAFSLVVSLGAAAVSAILLLVAILGINRRVEFNAVSGTIRIAESHLLKRRQERELPFFEVAGIELVSHDWSDGPSTYDLRLVPKAGKAFAFGDFSKRADAETVLASLKAMVNV
jgi:hypothetical protein